MTTASPLRMLIARFGFEFDPSGAISAEKTIGRVANVMGQLAAHSAVAIGVYRLARAFVEMTTDAVEGAKAIHDTSAKLGIAANQLEVFQQAAEENGASQQALITGLRNVAVNAERTGKGTAKAWQELGVSAKDASGKVKPTEQLFLEVGTALAGITDNAKRTAVAQKLFGRSGTELLGIFSRGKEGTKAYFEELQKLNGGYSDEFVAASNDAVVAQKRFTFALKGFKSELIVAFLPAVTFLLHAFTQVTTYLTDVFKHTEFLRAGWIIFTGIVARLAGMLGVKLWPALFRILTLIAPIIAKFIILQLIIDDILVFLEGGESVIGKFLDALFGVGTAQAVLKELKGIWQDFTENVIPAAMQVVSDLWSFWKGVFTEAIDWISGKFTELHAALVSWLTLHPEIAEDWENIKKIFLDGFNWIADQAKKILPINLLHDLFDVVDQKANDAARAEARARGASPQEAAKEAKAAGVSVKAFRSGAVDTFGGFHPAVVGAPGAAGQAAASVVRVPAPQGPVVNQVNNTEIKVDARGKDAKNVARETTASLRGVHRDSRNAALNALEQQ